jgi:hypothetical protein
MNDDQQATEGVEISDYVGEAGSPHPVRHSANDGKAEDVSSPRCGRAITVWAVVGLLCTIAGPAMLFSNAPYHFLLALGLDYDRYYNLYIAASWLPIALGVLGLIISIVTLILSRRASLPSLVVMSSLTGLLLILIAILTVYLFISSLNGHM